MSDFRMSWQLAEETRCAKAKAKAEATLCKRFDVEFAERVGCDWQLIKTIDSLYEQQEEGYKNRISDIAAMFKTVRDKRDDFMRSFVQSIEDKQNAKKKVQSQMETVQDLSECSFLETSSEHASSNLRALAFNLAGVLKNLDAEIEGKRKKLRLWSIEDVTSASVSSEDS